MKTAAVLSLFYFMKLQSETSLLLLPVIKKFIFLSKACSKVDIFDIKPIQKLASPWFV